MGSNPTWPTVGYYINAIEELLNELLPEEEIDDAKELIAGRIVKLLAEAEVDIDHLENKVQELEWEVESLEGAELPLVSHDDLHKLHHDINEAGYEIARELNISMPGGWYLEDNRILEIIADLKKDMDRIYACA